MVHIYQSYSINEFLLYEFVATRISFGCSLSPLHFIQASTVTTLPSIAAHPAFRYTCYTLVPIFYISTHDFIIACLYAWISEPLQKIRVRLWPCKTGLSPPLTVCY